MKTVRKALLLVLCAVLLAAATAMGTLAYFTSTDSATNTFTVGKVEITLDEAKVGEDGKAVTPEVRVDKNEYNDIKPGHSYDKDPTVTVLKKSENCYVRMLVTVNYKKEADPVLAKHNYRNWFDWSEDWTAQENVITSKTETHTTRTYEFRYNGNDPENPGNGIVVKNVNDKTVLDDLFETISIPGEITGPELATLEGLSINIVAQAIQADGFANADAAWAEWK